MRGSLAWRFTFAAVVWAVGLQVTIDRGWYPQEWHTTIWAAGLVTCGMVGAWALTRGTTHWAAIVLQVGACFLGTVSYRLFWVMTIPAERSAAQMVRFVLAGVSIPFSSPEFWRYLAIFWAPVMISMVIALAAVSASHRVRQRCA